MVPPVTRKTFQWLSIASSRATSTTTHRTASSIRYFQQNDIKRSYRMRGVAARNHTVPYVSAITLSANQKIGTSHTFTTPAEPNFAGHNAGPLGPPRNSVTVT